MLLVGDPHVKPDNIKESERLMEFVVNYAIRPDVNKVVILGDLFHTHRVIRMEVQNFWIKWAKEIAKFNSLILLVGNHDQPGDDQNESVMSALDILKGIPNVTIVDKPKIIDDVTYLPHTADHEKFAHWVSEANTKILTCHQTIDGSQYENGFYAKDGLPIDLFKKFELVISGHIHMHQEFANVWFPGTARWDSASDANEDKAIWLFDEQTKKRTKIPTDSVCSPIISLVLNEGEDVPNLESFGEGARIYIKLVGASSWIGKMAKELKGKAKLSSKPTDTRFSGNTTQLSSLESYAESFKFEGTNKDEVLNFLRENT